jgi:serine/threonine protein kinase
MEKYNLYDIFTFVGNMPPSGESKVYRVDLSPGATGTKFEKYRDIPLCLKVYELSKNTADYISQFEIIKILQETHPELCEVTCKYYELFGSLNESSRLCLLMERVDGKDLYECGIDSFHKFRLGRLKEICFKIISTMNTFHKHSLYHRDIKPENIVLAGDEIKFIDLDFAFHFTPGCAFPKLKGTPKYLDPLLVDSTKRGDTENLENILRSADKYSASMTIHYIWYYNTYHRFMPGADSPFISFTGKPYDPAKISRYLDRFKLRICGGMPPDIKTFISNSLKPTYRERES